MTIILRCKRPTAINYFLHLFYFINLLSFTKCELCKNGLHQCQPFWECEAFEEMSNIDYQKLQFCNIKTGTVCCEDVLSTSPLAPPEEENVGRPFEKDCRKWQRTIYSTCPKAPPVFIVVAGGQDAAAREFPHMALVGIYANFEYDWFCGGSLISPKFVLTAAHCIKVGGGKTPNRVRLGEVDYNSTKNDEHTQEFAVKKSIVYPKYKPPHDYFDIALIELDGVATINRHVAPICLPSTDGSEYEGRLFAAGWGYVDFAGERASNLQKITLERFDDQFCRHKAGISQVSLPRGLDVTSQFCAGSKFDKQDTCGADSGGPLFKQQHSLYCRLEIQGVTSFGLTTCGRNDTLGVYTRVLPYVDWIESIVWRENDLN